MEVGPSSQTMETNHLPRTDFMVHGGKRPIFSWVHPNFLFHGPSKSIATPGVQHAPTSLVDGEPCRWGCPSRTNGTRSHTTVTYNWFSFVARQSLFPQSSSPCYPHSHHLFLVYILNFFYKYSLYLLIVSRL